MYFEKEIETIDRDALAALQCERLRETIANALRSPFYKKRLTDAGVTPESIRTLDDARRIPFTTKDDLRVSYPKGMLAANEDDIVRMHASSGTTGKPTVVYHTREDIHAWTSLVARGLYMAGMRKHDVFQNMMTYGLFTGGLGLHYGAEALGAMVIPSSSGNTKRQVNLMLDFNTTAVHITPSYALHLAEEVATFGIRDPKDLGLQFAVMGAEPYSLATTKKIEDAFGLTAFNCYGLSEMNGPAVAFECPEKQGLHIWEDSYLVELIDPETLEPAKEGEKGELVLTTLARKGMPVLRYRTKDLTYVYNERCACGRTHKRIERILGRTDDMLIISGVNVFPSQVEHVLMEIPEVGNNYQIELTREGHLDRMLVRVEIYEKLFKGNIRQLHEIQHRIAHELKSALLVSAKVQIVEQGTLPPSTGKAVRVIDNRGVDE